MILSNKPNQMTFNIIEETVEILEPIDIRVGLHPFLCGMLRHKSRSTLIPFPRS